jgi:hypothetical protein
MTKPLIEELLSSGKIIPVSMLRAKKGAQAATLKAFEDAAIEQSRNQRFQAPKATGSITKPYKRETFEG